MQTAPAAPPRVHSASPTAVQSLRAPLIVALAAIGSFILLLQPLAGTGLFPAASQAVSINPAPTVTWGVSAKAAPIEIPAATASASAPAPQLATGLRSARRLAAMAAPLPPARPELPQGTAPASARTEAAAISSEPAPIPPPPESPPTRGNPPQSRAPLPLQTAVVPLDHAALRGIPHPTSADPALFSTGVRFGSSGPNG